VEFGALEADIEAAQESAIFHVMTEEKNLLQRLRQAERVFGVVLEPLRPLWYIVLFLLILGGVLFTLDVFIAPKSALIPDDDESSDEEEDMSSSQNHNAPLHDSSQALGPDPNSNDLMKQNSSGSHSADTHDMDTSLSQQLRQRIQRGTSTTDQSSLHAHMFENIEKAISNSQHLKNERR